MWVNKQHLEPDMEQLTGLKLGKEDDKGLYCHPVYLTYIQSTSLKIPGWMNHSSVQFSSVQSHSPNLCNPWTVAHQASLSITNSQSLLKFLSIESVLPSNHLILCHPLLLLPSIFPSLRVFSKESVLCTRWQKYWSFSFRSVLPMNIQDWFPLGLSGLISLQSNGLSRVFSNTTVQRHHFLGAQPSLWSNSDIHTWLLEKP